MAGQLILVVEDDPPSRRVLVDFLTLHGYVVACATTGEDAIAFTQREHPSLVLMDIRMPGMGGVAATQALRADPTLARLKILALTASGTKSELQSYEAAHFDAVYLKPLDLPAVVQAIDRLLGDPDPATNTSAPPGTVP